MIERLRVRSFQVHEDLELIFGEGVTTLVGPSYAGKSAALRGLKWLLTNRPLGAAFVGDWGKAPFAWVRGVVDGRIVSRKKGKGVNQYRLDGHVLKAFGAEPPDHVADLANVGPVNFQGQHDPVFWFTLPPPQVSKELNAIINLGAIDACLAEAAKEVRVAKARVKVGKERLAKARETIKTTRWAVEFSEDVNRLTSIFGRLTVIENKRTRINDLVRAGQCAKEGVDRAAAMAKLGSSCEASYRRWRAIADRVDGLREVVKKVRTIRKALRDRPKPVELQGLLRLRQKADAINRRVTELRAFTFGATNLQWEIEECQKRIKEAKVKMRAMTPNGGRCPVCRRPYPSRRA